MLWAPLLRIWLYVFADTALWLDVMSRVESLIEERGALAYLAAMDRLKDAQDSRGRWLWRLVLAQLAMRRPPLTAAL